MARQEKSILHCLYETEQWLKKHCLDKIAKTKELTFEERVRSKRRKTAFQSWAFVTCGLALVAKAHISSKFTNGDFKISLQLPF